MFEFLRNIDPFAPRHFALQLEPEQSKLLPHEEESLEQKKNKAFRQTGNYQGGVCLILLVTAISYKLCVEFLSLYNQKYKFETNSFM